MGDVSEAQLMRNCSPLYAAWAFESLAAFVMSIIFSYLLLLITNKGRLHSPGRAMYRLLSKMLGGYLSEVWENSMKWPYLTDKPILERFAFCAKTNQAICAMQIVVAFVTSTRWLHIGNVNGFRYLGYAVTCPPMQAELVIMLAPVIPFYKTSVVFTWLITFIMLITGYGASLIEGKLADGDWDTFVSNGNIDDLKLTSKFYWLAPSMGILVWLVFVQFPILLGIYWYHGGVKASLPIYYPKLVLIVAITWLTFPLWWLVSFEGLALLEDTKLNGIGFAFLNVISKAGFSLQVLKMSAWHRKQKRIQEKRAQSQTKSGVLSDGPERERRSSVDSNENQETLWDGPFDRNVSPARPQTEQDQLQKAKRRNTGRKETWMVRVLRGFDEGTGAGDVWDDLEGPYQAFLMGAGYEPKTFNKLQVNQKHELQERYDLLSCKLQKVNKEDAEQEAPKIPQRPEATLLGRDANAHGL